MTVQEVAGTEEHALRRRRRCRGWCRTSSGVAGELDGDASALRLEESLPRPLSPATEISPRADSLPRFKSLLASSASLLMAQELAGEFAERLACSLS